MMIKGQMKILFVSDGRVNEITLKKNDYFKLCNNVNYQMRNDSNRAVMVFFLRQH